MLIRRIEGITCYYDCRRLINNLATRMPSFKVFATDYRLDGERRNNSRQSDSAVCYVHFQCTDEFGYCPR